jgi:RecA/RadA recombinase
MRPIDLSKFRKSLTKSIEGLTVGFNDPTDWVSTGNYTLNYLISGDFKKGIPLGKVSMFFGESGCLPESAKVRICIKNKELMEIKEVTVKELKSLWDSNQFDIEIDTPDGFQKITHWFNKGVLPMVEISTASGLSTRCATNHLLQNQDQWIPAGQIVVGDSLLTEKSINDEVTLVTEITPEYCYDFTVDHSNHRYWGDRFSSHNSGKSYICSGNIVRNCQLAGIYPVIIDTENALDESWLQALGVDTSEGKMLKLSMSMIDDVAKTISTFMNDYKSLPEGERPKVLFIIDSLGMLLTPTDVNQFDAGDLKGDLGRKPKALTALVRNCVNMFGNYNVGMVCTNHSYASMDPYNPDQISSGGAGAVYAASIVVAMKKLKLKEDEDGNKTSEVLGIRAGCKITKTRYSKPFEDIQIQIPFSTGMNPYSGMFDMLESKKLITKDGNRYVYTDLAGKEHKYFRKEWNRNEDGIFDLVMNEFSAKEKLKTPTVIGADLDEE